MALPLLRQLWTELRGDPHAVDAVRVRGSADLPSRLPVGQLAVSTAVVHLLAAQRLRSLTPEPRPLEVDAAHVGVEFASERHLRVDGVARAGGFAALSRFWPTSDGWVRVHANYPHHRAALLRALRLDGGPVGIGVGSGDGGRGADEARRVGDVLAGMTSDAVEDAVVAAGGLAVVVRTPQEWSATPMGAALIGAPLVALDRVGEHPRRERGIAGARVLDLTRVVAGPTATRALAAHGADVLRLDPPHLPDLTEQRLETGPGKRNAQLDLATPAGAKRLEELLAGADVLVHGYRPGALARFGLDGPSLAQRHPHLVVASLSAWGTSGPWAQRRGFDSLVQAASGIAVMTGAADGRPGVLPVQALDHAAGQLLAAAVLRALDFGSSGGTWHARTSLAGLARWLLASAVVPAADAATPPHPEPANQGRYLVDLPSPEGTLTVVRPLGAPAWACGPVPSDPEWLPRG